MAVCCICMVASEQEGQVEGCATCCFVAGTRETNGRMRVVQVWLRIGMRRHTPEKHSALGYSNHNGASLLLLVLFLSVMYALVAPSLFGSSPGLFFFFFFFVHFSSSSSSSSSSFGSLSSSSSSFCSSCWPDAVLFLRPPLHLLFFLDVAPSGHDPDLTRFA